MAWKDHKKWHGGKEQQLAAGQPIHRPSTIPVPDPLSVKGAAKESNQEAAAVPPHVPQGNFVASISVSPAIMQSRNLTADSLQVALDAALQALVRYEKTISVHVEAVAAK
jgi:hypothetical protein